MREGDDRDEVVSRAARRFGDLGHVIGDAGELLDHFGRRRDDGIERVYVWTTDFGDVDSLAELGETVIEALG